MEDAYVTVNGIQENVHTDNPAEKVYKRMFPIGADLSLCANMIFLF